MGEVKSVAAVRVPLKMVFVMESRSTAMEMAWRRRRPSSPVKWGSHCGIVKHWMPA